MKACRPIFNPMGQKLSPKKYSENKGDQMSILNADFTLNTPYMPEAKLG